MSIDHIKQLAFFIVIFGGLQFLLINFVQSEPTTLNPDFTIQRVIVGDFEPSSMTFLGPDDLLVLDRDEGKVYRIENGIESGPLLDVNVATDGYRGLLGAAASIDNSGSTELFLYFTEARSDDGDDSGKNSIEPLGNRLYRYDLVDNKLINPKLLLDLPALPGPRHAGGVVAVGPDNNIYLTIGDLDGTFRYKQYETKSQNYQDGSTPDGRSGILVVDRNGKPAANQTLGNSFPLNLYYAYGIRNSFGIDWDPLTGYLWDSENGPDFGDELNLVLPGFNSGWAAIQGYWKPHTEKKGPVSLELNDLETFGGHGTYRPPDFVWLNPVAPSAIKFLDSEKYGFEYRNDLLVGDANYGNIYDFNLDEQRRNLDLSGKLSDKIANNTEEMNDVIFAKGFGKVTDMEIDPEGFLHVLSTQKHVTSIYRIGPR
ncbi:MAG TPA: PQQ-dependent sugar dehydrogenase [Nitrososphaeraceae archaeon]|nr:PQQ-dependent sugar dehydrogenase [Nitrososphaeraceae archaeon]